VRDLLLLAHIADGAQWPSRTSAPVRQPIRVSISIPYDLRPAADGDDISKSINYGSLSKRVLASIEEEDPSSLSTREFRSLKHLSDHIFAACFGAFPEIRRMTLDVVKPRALPYADGIRFLSSRARDDDGGPLRFLSPDRLSIQQLSCNVIVGLNPCEREDKQLVRIDVDISTTKTREPGNAFDFRQLARDIRQVRAFWMTCLERKLNHTVRKLRPPSLYPLNRLRPWSPKSRFATLIGRMILSPFALRSQRLSYSQMLPRLKLFERLMTTQR